MPPIPCATHPAAAAVYRCDGCGKPLCSECIEEGHRLFFCRLCGERALPLAAGAPTSTPDLKRRRAVHAPYSWGEALFYPFRGLGIYVFAGYAVLLAILDVAGGMGCPLGFVRLLILLLYPGFLYAIVRTTAEGDNELPDWPDFTNVFDHIPELLWFVILSLFAFLPTLGLLYLGGCGLGLLLDPSGLGRCFLLLVLGSWMTAALWVAALGATGVYTSYWLTLRLDLHLRALLAGGKDTVVVVAFVYFSFLASQILQGALGIVPMVGVVLATVIGVYFTLTGAHLVGLLFRRHESEMEHIYLG